MANLEPPQVGGGAPPITVKFWCHTIDQTSPEEFAPDDAINVGEDESLAHCKFAVKLTGHVKRLLFENTEPDVGNRRRIVEREAIWRIIAGICQNGNSVNYDFLYFEEIYHILSDTASFLKTMFSQGPRVYYEQQKKRKLVLNKTPFWARDDSSIRDNPWIDFGENWPELMPSRSRIEISSQERAKNNFGGHAAIASTAENVVAGHIIPDSCLSPTRDSQDPGQVHRPIMAMMFDHVRVFIRDKYTHLRQVLREEDGLVKNIIPLDESLQLQYDAGRVLLRSIKSSEPNRQYLQLLRTTPRDPLRLESSNDIWDSSRTLEDEDLEGGLTDSARRGGKRDPHYIRHGDVFCLESRDLERFPLPSHEIMELWLDLSRITHNVKAKGALGHLFRDPAPDLDEGSVLARTDEALQSTFAPLILLAEEERILDADKATRLTRNDWLLR
ncbi:hypothetical protein PG985_004029 [Apiospora marii]|uniref:uncharacterized protein n=1 Tax=Apiospora marii TaxID=335849 RepID=UPI00312F139D